MPLPVGATGMNFHRTSTPAPGDFHLGVKKVWTIVRIPAARLEDGHHLPLPGGQSGPSCDPREPGLYHCFFGYGKTSTSWARGAPHEPCSCQGVKL